MLHTIFYFVFNVCLTRVLIKSLHWKYSIHVLVFLTPPYIAYCLIKQLVGKLIYLLHARPDITYSLSVVSQFMHLQGDTLGVVCQIHCYLKSAPVKPILFQKFGKLESEAYSKFSRQFQLLVVALQVKVNFRILNFLRGKSVSWRSKK